MMKIIVILTIVLFSSILGFTDEYDFTPPESSTQEKKSQLLLFGSLEGSLNIMGLNKSSPIYHTKFYKDKNHSSPLDKYFIRFDFNGDYKYEKIGFHVKSRINYISEEKVDFVLNEAYNYILFSPNFTIETGKKIIKWGPGYVFNPVGFLNPVKEVEYPEKENEGLIVLAFDFIKSINSTIVKNVGFTGVIIPVNEQINQQFGQTKNIKLAAKLSVLFLDCDIDITGLWGNQEPSKLGMAFSRNIVENLVINLEFAYTFGDRYTYVNDTGNLLDNKKDSYSILAGIRYLSSFDLTIIFEYFHNGNGNTNSEFKNFLSSLNRNYSNYTLSGDTTYMNNSSQLIKNYTDNKTFLLRDYLYLKLSQKDIFAVLYLNLYASFLFNINDKSAILMPGISYRPYTNIELDLSGQVTFGKSDSEYGSKQNKWFTELTVKVYFDNN